MSFKFSMPHMSRYVFYSNGEVQSKATGRMQKRTNYNTGNLYGLWNDHDEKEHVSRNEIVQYGHHLRASETKKEAINRILYSRVERPTAINNMGPRKTP